MGVLDDDMNNRIAYSCVTMLHASCEIWFFFGINYPDVKSFNCTNSLMHWMCKTQQAFNAKDYHRTLMFELCTTNS